MIFGKLKDSLKKTKDAMDLKINNIFANKKEINEIIDSIEEMLILSDVGASASVKICDELREDLKKEMDKSEENIKKLLKDKLISILNVENVEENYTGKRVILVVGVNGVGKTTSIAKIANLEKENGKRVLLVAADTFRAGAIEQLDVWAKRINVPVVMGKEMQDPSSVVFEGAKTFSTSDFDLMICDTAGRLHNKKNLMDELEKMKRTIDKNLPGVKIDVYIVLDSTTGQNALFQVKSFFERTSVNGIILTKLDSTAKGGVVFSIVSELNIPIKYIGLGEKVEDIAVFDSKDFIDSII
ncbi:MAG: signal recognition particle-docking protein FtsY [Clostridia bacterium]|nr:signal recognition particle-docking protein FtsY [Clostridia bacterium]